MKYFTLVAITPLLIGCSHSCYTQAHVPSTPLFHKYDDVELSQDSVACKEGLAICRDTGVVMDIVDIKNACYPQASYEIKFYNQIDTYVFCAEDLLLLRSVYQ